MYNPDYFGIMNNGWVCPQCHKTFAPHVSECPYCNAERKTFATTGTNINDNTWWEEYLEKSQSGNPVNDNPSTTTATTNIKPNIKVTTWNNMETGRVEIGKYGSIKWHGPTPEVYLKNMSWRDWLDKQTNVWEE